MYHYLYSEDDDDVQEDWLDEQIPPPPIEDLPIGLIADEM